MSTWENGIAFGQALERIRSVSERTSHLEERTDQIEERVTTLETWGVRAAVLVALWAGGIGINVAPEQLASLLATALKLKQP